MSLVLVDCPTGLAGDMLLAALLDLGVDEAVIHRPLADLGLAGRYRLESSEGHSEGLRGRRLMVVSLEPEPGHRHWRELQGLLQHAPWPEPLRQKVLAVFRLLAEAEGAVHGQPPEAVHFHEVGAIDALVDIVGVCAGLLELGVERLICGVPPAGHGSVLSAHGRLPLPAPAVLEIARRGGIPLASSADFPPGELTTPTGLALMACWADGFALPPTALPLRLGVGLGSRQLDRPNLLRLTLATSWDPHADRAHRSVGQERLETLVLQQCQIDDANGEELAFLQDQLRQAGALEVFSQPISMKKGRPALLLSALVTPESAARLRRIWWRHSTSLGLRETLQPRWALQRQSRRVSTELGEVGLKRAILPEGEARVKIEHDDLAAIALRQGLSLAEVRQRLHQSLRQAGDPWFAASPVPNPPAAPDSPLP